LDRLIQVREIPDNAKAFNVNKKGHIYI